MEFLLWLLPPRLLHRRGVSYYVLFVIMLHMFLHQFNETINENRICRKYNIKFYDLVLYGRAYILFGVGTPPVLCRIAAQHFSGICGIWMTKIAVCDFAKELCNLIYRALESPH